VRPVPLPVADLAWALVRVTIVQFGADDRERPVEAGRVPAERIEVLGDDARPDRRGDTLAAIARTLPDDAWILPIDGSDELATDALERLAAVAIRTPRTDLVYADEARGEDGDGALSLKPAWSPHMLWAHNYIGHPYLVRAGLVNSDPSDDGSIGGEHALLVRVAGRARRVAHVPDVLCWSRAPRERESRETLTRAIERHIDGRTTSVELSPHSVHGDRWTVDLHARTRPSVQIIVPFRDRADLLETVSSGVLSHTDHDNFELVLVDTGSTEAATRDLLQQLAADPRVHVIDDAHQPFNYSAVNDRAAAVGSSELVLLLNNDIEIVDPAWLDRMCGWAIQPDVGTVGARLDYPNGLVQHAGVVLGIGGYASHPLARSTPGTPSAWGDVTELRDVLASTAACVLVAREKFDSVGGLDATFQLCGSDVALGLALHERGLWNVQLPHVRLVHHESVTRGTEIPRGDFIRSREVYQPWVGGRDPFYHPALTLDSDSCELRADHEGHLVPPVRWSRHDKDVHE